MTKLTYQQAFDYVKAQGKPTKLGVDSNPPGEGGYNEIYFVIHETGYLSSFEVHTGFNLNKDDVEYEWSTSWGDAYQGNFYLLDDSNNQETPVKYNVAEPTLPCPNCGAAIKHEGSVSMNKKLTKGFDPENLTFDGVKIEEGDEVEILTKYGLDRCEVVFDACNQLALRFEFKKCKPTLVLQMFNILAHYPKKDPELERLEREYDESARALENHFFERGKKNDIGRIYKDIEVKDHYYQARKALEEYKSNNNLIPNI